MAKLLTEKEAAAKLGWKVSNLQQRRHRGLPPPYVKIGRSVRYREEDIEAYINASIVHPVVEDGGHDVR